MRLDLTRLQDFGTRYAAAWCSQDPDSVAAFYSPAGSLAINGGTASVGRAAIAAAARSFMTDFPDLCVVMDKVLTRGECAEFHWTLTGTNTGPGGKGQRVRISGFELWEIGGDGLIDASQGSFDAAEYQRQLEHGADER